MWNLFIFKNQSIISNKSDKIQVISLIMFLLIITH